MAAEEADVDIEGDVVPAAAQSGSDENTASVLQDHYLDSSWRTENGLIPWTLDSTISEENRAVIEKMLLEEEYYLSKKSLPGKFWLDQKEDDKKYMKSLQKPAKIMVHSPTKPASYSVKWTVEEKELFEQGLAKFGRRWTKIAKLVGSRSVLQVKSYARQYFKNKEESHEEEELKPPEQEIEIDRDIIQEEEKQAIPEFFEGRQAKTPERYLKIRNYILDQWEICKPKYLNKTSVRPGLKNCGDVNCIGRIHTYLELIGAINFGCEQAVYNRPQPVDKVRIRDRKDTVEAYQLAQRLQSMRTRRRRVRDPWGNWCDAKDLEGQTFEHLSAEELARRREEEKCKPGKSSKVPRPTKSSFDPFQLIPCNFFSEEKQEPFQVKVASEALLIMDLHAHVSMAEVIGLLGGRYSEVDKIVEVCAAEPCNSLSTGLQCEMDPVSQTQASETLAVRGYSVIGWYHSHPAFDPNPSLRDIDTQAKYQSYFSRGGAKFIGMIVSPYNRNNPLPYSQITCLVISDEISPDGSYRLPYKFEVQQMLEEPRWGLVLEKTKWIIEKYRLSRSSVPMDKIFRRDSDLTCLQKLLECLRKTLSKVANCFIAEEFLTQIENLFLSNYKSQPENGVAEEKCAVEPKALLT
ncbi:histone H2A deubiquitinase MYSM1 isoform X2 [Monodon monoceros]|uniref:Deubiquitinase MYSM1 n=1 Tax=Delphinapterus leucas TaxID=9749 RepID=A0A2Y9N9N0_DELLE|nr:histone H2A deubiquitinase MYSM1 isoform X2 [Delphinapterus leucas]XP_029085155.1 histone H2A deubiquitinase MYSM1 isoform X2 [Monodon monoceros]